MPSGPRRRTTKVEQFLPLGYFAVALLLVLVVLPTVLRTPSQHTNDAAELSPDAPPDKHQNSILASLNSASSGTAGNGSGQGPGELEASAGGLPPPVPTQTAPKGCAFGYGNPPRQTFSVYAPPCAPAFHGDNGGATYKGVTRDEIRLAIGDPDTNWGNNGLVPASVDSNMGGAMRTLVVIQQWLNSRYQFWGRHVQLVLVNGSEDQATERQLAQEADEQWHVFAGAEGREATMTEFARRNMIDIGDIVDQLPRSYFNSKAPWNYGIGMDATQLMQLTAELTCKQLKDRLAAYAGDPVIQGQTRKFGLLYLNNGSYGQAAGELESSLHQQCGAQLAEKVAFTSSTVLGVSDTNSAASAIAKMRQAGVTTVILGIDWPTAIVLTNEAANEGYFPEWEYAGAGSIDSYGVGRDMHPAEWSHAFGISSWEIPQRAPETECYQAYQSVDPANTPDSLFCSNHFYELIELANGIQQAGPKLTPETFRQGLFKLGFRAPAPKWSMGGGFGPAHYSFSNYVALIWWSSSATAPDGYPSTWMYANNGDRYGPGEIPTGDIGLFKRGVSMAPPSG